MQPAAGRVFWFLLAAIAFNAACAGRTLSPPPPDTTPMLREPYKLGVMDVIRVSVWRNPELSVEVPVRSDGMVSVPLIDDIRAAGLTPPELKGVVTKELSEYVESPDVTIIVMQMNSRYVSVIGEVARENRIPLTQDLRVLEAIALAGGFTTFADKGDVRVVRRQSDGSEVEYLFDYNAYVKGNAPGTNVVLQPGDTVIVPE